MDFEPQNHIYPQLDNSRVDNSRVDNSRVDNSQADYADRGHILAGAAAQLGKAIGELELVCASARARADQKKMAVEQRLEQHIQSLKVQSAYWQREAEKQAAAHAELHEQQSKVQQAEIESWRQKVASWQEKAESWKEEARRAEEARVAALHNVGSAEVKALASEASESIDHALAHIHAALERKKSRAEG